MPKPPPKPQAARKSVSACLDRLSLQVTCVRPCKPASVWPWLGWWRAGGLARAGARLVAGQRDCGQALGEGPARESSLAQSKEKDSTLTWLRVDETCAKFPTHSNKTWAVLWRRVNALRTVLLLLLLLLCLSSETKKQVALWVSALNFRITNA